jgi:zinc transport system substrate-binding protein
MLLASLALTAAFTLAAQESGTDETKPLVVHTTFHPTSYFTKRIGGPHVEVRCRLPPGVAPGSWRPARETIAEMQAADLIVLNGAGLERWVKTASLPASRVVDTARGFQDEWLEIAGSVTHSHGKEGAHTHAGVDPHVWLDPLLATKQAAAIRDALIARRKGAANDFERGFAALERDLQALDRAYRALPAQQEPTWLYAAHPSYDYLARRYQLRIESLHLDADAPPTTKVHGEIESATRKRPAHYILWEREPAAGVATLIERQFGLKSVVVATAASLSAEETHGGQDYLTIQLRNIAAFQRCLSSSR